MLVLKVRNVQEALPAGLALVRHGADGMGFRRADSRNGPVYVCDSPVTTQYLKPTERVLFWAERDANPFFHLMESLWMLAGRNDLAFVQQYAKQMRAYSDDGKTLHGAYGHRWRRHFKMDQLVSVVSELRSNTRSRRAVLQMWDAQKDLFRSGRDFPCNLVAHFQIVDPPQNEQPAPSLNMTVFCRSNDMLWGAYGANAVHFSVLQEFVAAACGVGVGTYWQVSSNYHVYEEKLNEGLAFLADKYVVGETDGCPYVTGAVQPYPLVQTPVGEWLEDLAMMLDEGVVLGLRDPFFRRVAVPMMMAHRAYSDNTDEERFDKALEIVRQCQASDWRVAATEWLERRKRAAR